MADSDFLIAGLGNPGAKYAATRHNIGFMALDRLGSAVDCSPTQVKFDGIFCRQRLFDKQVVLVKPETFMNRSGQCIGGFVNFFKIPKSNILILHDDLDLSPGRVKVVARGGAGGHNGIRSLVQHLGSQDFARVKVGIGRPERNENGQGIPVENYVLSKFNREEEQAFDALFEITNLAVELFLTQGIDTCMNQINRK
jgi:PTH1 family peptidyl-tRNA hydrolase